MVDIPKDLRCVVVTPEKAVLDESADSIVLPMFDGELGVLPQRAPLIGRLGYGELRIRKGETTQRLFLDGGFAQVRANVVTVLTPRALKVEELKVEAIQQTLDEAMETTADAEEQERKLKAQERARVMLRVAKKVEE